MLSARSRAFSARLRQCFESIATDAGNYSPHTPRNTNKHVERPEPYLLCFASRAAQLLARRAICDLEFALPLYGSTPLTKSVQAF
jgi:hypothetical protein